MASVDKAWTDLVEGAARLSAIGVADQYEETRASDILYILSPTHKDWRRKCYQKFLYEVLRQTKSADAVFCCAVVLGQTRFLDLGLPERQALLFRICNEYEGKLNKSGISRHAAPFAIPKSVDGKYPCFVFFSLLTPK